MRRIPFFILFVFLMFGTVFGKDNDLRSAKQLIVEYMKNEGAHSLGEVAVPYNKYLHPDYSYPGGDSAIYKIVMTNFQISDTKFLYDDINVQKPHKEKLLMITVKFHSLGTLDLQKNSFSPNKKIYLKKFYLSKFDGSYLVLEEDDPGMEICFKETAVSWLIKRGTHEKILKALQEK